MRRSGRTTRIKNFIVDQLMSVGGCVATDHTSFEHESVPLNTIMHLIKSVVKDIDEISNGKLIVTYNVHRIDGITIVIFKTKLNKDEKISSY